MKLSSKLMLAQLIVLLLQEYSLVTVEDNMGQPIHLISVDGGSEWVEIDVSTGEVVHWTPTLDTVVGKVRLFNSLLN